MRGLDMSSLMLPAATMTTMSNTGPIPVSQAKMDPVKSGLLLNNNNILNSKQQLQQGKNNGCSNTFTVKSVMIICFREVDPWSGQASNCIHRLFDGCMHF